MVLDFLRSAFSRNKVLKFDEVLIREYKTLDKLSCKKIAKSSRVTFEDYYEFKFVADYGGSVVGFFCGDIDDENDNVFICRSVAVLGSTRKLGIGSLFVSKMISICSENGIDKIRLLAAQLAVGFWRKKGFKFVDNQDQFLVSSNSKNSRFENSVWMELVIDKFDWIKKRAEKDFIKLVNIYGSDENSFSVISVDMQRSFFYYLNPKFIPILTYYHNCIRDLCLKNNLKFINLVFRAHGESVIKESSVTFEKSSDGVVNCVDLFNFLRSNNCKNLYVIGINRNFCVFNSIIGLIDNGFNISTSFLGTMSNEDAYVDRMKNKETIKSKTFYGKYYLENGFKNFTLKDDIKLLLKKGVNILDYNLGKK